MYEFKLKTMNKGRQLTLEEMLDQLKNAPQGKPFLISFSPVGKLSIPIIEQLLTHFPPECEGLDLASLIGTAQPLETIQKICALLPNKLKRLQAEIVLPHNPAPSSIKAFIDAIPKTEHLSLAKNDLYYMQDEVFCNFSSVRILDINDNQWHRRWPAGTFAFLKHLSTETTDLYIDLYPASDETARLAMRQNFFDNLPAHIHTLGLNFYDFQHTSSDLIWMKASISTLKWIKHWKHPLPTHLESTPFSVKTLDLSAWEFGRKPYAEVNVALALIPEHVTTLILNNNDFHLWSQEHFVAFVGQISSHIKSIHLKGNQLFAGKNVNEKNQLLDMLKPYNFDARLILEDNDYAPEASQKVAQQQPQHSSLHNNMHITASPYFMSWLDTCITTPLEELPEETQAFNLNPNKTK